MSFLSRICSYRLPENCSFIPFLRHKLLKARIFHFFMRHPVYYTAAMGYKAISSWTLLGQLAYTPFTRSSWLDELLYVSG